MWCSPFCSHVIGCCMSSSSDTQLLHYYYSTTQQKLQKWCVVLLKFFPSLFLPYDKYIQRVKWYCSLSLVKWQSVGAHRYLLDNTLLYGLVMQPPQAVLGAGPRAEVCWTPVYMFHAHHCVFHAYCCGCLAAQHSSVCTWEHSSGLHQERTTTLCDSRFLRCGDSFDTSLCDWIAGLYGPVTARWDEPWQGKCITGSDSDKKSL